MWEVGAALRAGSLFILPFNPGVPGGSEVKVGRRKAAEEEKSRWRPMCLATCLHVDRQLQPYTLTGLSIFLLPRPREVW